MSIFIFGLQKIDTSAEESKTAKEAKRHRWRDSEVDDTGNRRTITGVEAKLLPYGPKELGLKKTL